MLGELLLHFYDANLLHVLGVKKEVHLSPSYKNYFDQIKAKFGELIDTIVPLIGTRFHELKPHLSTAESFDDVIELMKKKKCTIANITCLETIVNDYNVENARPHVTVYKSAVNEICVKFKHRVLENENVTNVSTFFKYESIMFVIKWQQTDDLTHNDIHDLLSKAFGDMAKEILFKYEMNRKLTK